MSPPPHQRPFEYRSTHSGFGFSDEEPDPHDESDDNMDDTLSNGNYSPPAWRRLQNGERWYGNWRESRDMLGGVEKPRRANGHNGHSIIFQDDIFEAARRTRLPTGSLSPEKGLSPEPEAPTEDITLVKRKSESSTEKCMDRESTHPGDIMASMSPDVTRDNCKSYKSYCISFPFFYVLFFPLTPPPPPPPRCLGAGILRQ